jgi:hypothetical protein
MSTPARYSRNEASEAVREITVSHEQVNCF